MVRRQEIINFVTPPPPKGGGKFRVNSIKVMFCFFFNLLFYFWKWFRQTKYIVMMTKEGSTKIANFMTL